VCIKKCNLKFQGVKNANIFKRKKQTKFVRTNEDRFIEENVVFGGLGM
jgi:hypothetical protein